MAAKKKVASKKKKAASKSGSKRMPKRQILIKGPRGKIYVLTEEQLKKCSSENDWARGVKDDYKKGKLKLYVCTVKGGTDDWDIWETNK